MNTILEKLAPENGTFVIQSVFTDEDGTEVVPTEILWTLTDKSGNIINSRDEVSETPASTIYIVLKGDDLARQSATDRGRRLLLVKWTYNSTYGSGLGQYKEAEFGIALSSLVGTY